MTDSAEVFEACARAALPTYGVDPAAEVGLLNVSENGTFLLTEPSGARTVLRVHRSGYHTERAIRSELAWVEALRSEGVVNTPAYLPAPDGSPVVAASAGGESRYVVRFEFVEGREPEESRLVGDFEELGRITARLHQHARSWHRPDWFSRFTWDYDTSLGARGHWGRWQDGLGVGRSELAVLGRLDETLRNRLTAYGQGADRFGLIHADTRLANLLVAGDRVSVIDFDDCGLSWFLYDLASAVSFIEHEPYVPELVDSWVRGYRDVAPLSAEEEAEIPTFIMLRRLLLVAWIGSHAETETAQEMGPEFATVSCDLAEKYLTEHA